MMRRTHRNPRKLTPEQKARRQNADNSHNRAIITTLGVSVYLKRYSRCLDSAELMNAANMLLDASNLKHQAELTLAEIRKETREAEQTPEGGIQ